MILLMLIKNLLKWDGINISNLLYKIYFKVNAETKNKPLCGGKKGKKAKLLILIIWIKSQVGLIVS